MSDTEGEAAGGEESGGKGAGKPKMQLGLLSPLRQIPLLGKGVISFELELKQEVVPKRPFRWCPNYFDWSAEAAGSVGLELELKGGNEEGAGGEELKKSLFRQAIDRICSQSLFEAALGIAEDEAKFIYDAEQHPLGDGKWEDVQPEFKCGVEGIELNVHLTRTWENAKPVPIEVEGSLVLACEIERLPNGDWDHVWKPGVFQLEASGCALQLPDFTFLDKVENSVAVKGVKFEGKFTAVLYPHWTQIWSWLGRKAESFDTWADQNSASLDRAMEKQLAKIPKNARIIGKWVSKQGETVVEWVGENSEEIVGTTIDIAIEVAAVVGIVVGLAEVICIIELGLELDALLPAVDSQMADLTSYYVQGLKGQELSAMAKRDEQGAAHRGGRKQREEVLADYGPDALDAWLAANEDKVVAAAQEKFKPLVRDALWAGFAAKNSQAVNQWMGWNTLYGRGNDPASFGPAKVQFFQKYANDPYGAPDGYLTGEWYQSGVDKSFMDGSS